MAKAELKTQRNSSSVKAFLEGVADERKRKDARVVQALMEEVTGEKAAMWGTSIVGFGSYHYKGAGGREGDWMLTGFSPRKDSLTLYLMSGFQQDGDLPVTPVLRDSQKAVLERVNFIGRILGALVE